MNTQKLAREAMNNAARQQPVQQARVLPPLGNGAPRFASRMDGMDAAVPVQPKFKI